MKDVTKNILVNLIAATSAYKEFAKGRDPFYSTRLKDFNKAIESGKKTYKKVQTAC